MRALGLIVATCASLAWAPTALADSIVYEKNGNIWQAAPDGSNQRQVTTAGGYSKPTQANDGTIVAVKGKLLHRMDRAGRVLNSAGDSRYSGPLTPAFSPNGALVAYNYNNTGSLSPGFHTTLSHSTRPTSHGEIFDISGWGNPTWIGNNRVLMFDASPSFTGDTLIHTVGGGTQGWYEDPDMSLSGGEVNAGITRFAATDSTKIRLYKVNSPPPAIDVEPRCDLIGPTGSFFRPTWSPDGVSLAWQEDDGIWAGALDLDSATCQPIRTPRLVIPGAKAPDWGPAGVSTPSASPAPAGTPTTGADKAAPALKTKIARRVRRSVLLRGLTVKLNCNERCRVTAELLIDRRTAKRLRLAARRWVRIGRAKKSFAGSAKLRLRPSAKARRRLRRGRLRSVTVRVRAVDAAGNRSRYVTRKVRVIR